MKKKLICMIVTVCIVLCSMPITSYAFATGIAVSTKEALFSTVADERRTEVYLNSDIDIDSTLQINHRVVLDLNGYVLRMTGNDSVIRVNPTGLLVIRDSRKDAVHKFTPNSDGLWVLDEANGTKTVNGGVITGNAEFKRAGGGVYVDANSTNAGFFNMAGGNIVGCTAREGGGVYINSYSTLSSSVRNNATFRMTYGSIIGCVAKCERDDTRGGGICNFGNLDFLGSATIKECRALECGGINFGGGILSVRNITIDENASVIDCTADGNSDALNLGTDVTGYATLAGGKISGNVMLSFNRDRSDLSDIVFNDEVYSTREINGGIFYGAFCNNGTIRGGTFYGEVTGDGIIDDSAKRTVTFDADGGSAADEQKILKGQKATAPTTSRDGFSFLGWYKNGTAYDFTQPVLEDFTVTAKWKDITAPVISGITDGKVYCEPQEVTVTDDNIDTVTVNGVTVALDSNGKFTLSPAEGEQKIVAKDTESNKAEMTVTINDGHTPAQDDGDCTTEVLCRYCGAVTIAAKSHTFGEGGSNDDGTHTVRCTNAGCTVTKTENCSGGTAYCSQKAICTVCGSEYGDYDSSNHKNLRHIASKAATEKEKGNIEYWYCGDCEKYFADEQATKEIAKSDTVIKKVSPKTTTKKSTKSNAKKAVKNFSSTTSPKTGTDGKSAVAMGSAITLGGALLLMISKKKKHDE